MLTKQRIIILIIILLSIPLVVELHASTVNAASCNQADVRTAVTNAVDGDTVFIPAGACTWSSTPIEVGSTSSRTKMIKILGAGISSSTGTRLTLNNTTNNSTTGACCPAFVFWLTHTVAALEISNVRWIQGNSWDNSDEEAVWAIQLAGHADTTGTLINIHNNWFEQNAVPGGTDCGTGGLQSPCPGNIVNSIRMGDNGSHSATYETNRPYIYGLIHHNTWHGPISFQTIDVVPAASYGEKIAHPSYTNEGYDAWNVPNSTHYNSDKNVFFEDNSYIATVWGVNQAATDAVGGGVFVYRHNLFWNMWLSVHGEEGYRAAKYIEVYNNDIVLDDTGGGYASPSNIRGGTGVYYNNNFFDGAAKGSYSFSGTNTWTDFFEAQYYRAFDSGRGVSGGLNCVGLCSNTGLTTGCDNHDHTVSPDIGWICGGQPGAAKGASQPTWAFGYAFATEPIVLWNNMYGASHALFLPFDGATANYVQERRDYIDWNSCVGHMGESICSTWWDDVNNKRKNYVAYTYPHPLQGGGGDSGQPPVNGGHRLRIIRRNFAFLFILYTGIFTTISRKRS